MHIPDRDNSPLHVKCPYCNCDNTMDRFGWYDLEDYGKHVSRCKKCKLYFVIRDEGEGPFVTGTKS